MCSNTFILAFALALYLPILSSNTRKKRKEREGRNERAGMEGGRGGRGDGSYMTGGGKDI